MRKFVGKSGWRVFLKPPKVVSRGLPPAKCWNIALFARSHRVLVIFTLWCHILERAAGTCIWPQDAFFHV